MDREAKGVIIHGVIFLLAFFVIPILIVWIKGKFRGKNEMNQRYKSQPIKEKILPTLFWIFFSIMTLGTIVGGWWYLLSKIFRW